MKNNIEVIVVMFITFFIFITLVVFYESKLPEYYNNSENLEIEIKVMEINDNILTIDGDYKNYIELDDELLNIIKEKKKYKITLEPTNENIEKGNVTKLFQKYKVVKVEE